jgi:hypothetical protein
MRYRSDPNDGAFPENEVGCGLAAEVWVYLDLARDYQLDALPCSEVRSALYRNGQTVAPDRYLEWLAEYLAGCRFTVGSWQRDLCARLQDAVDGIAAATALGINAAWHEDDVFDVEAIIDEMVDESISCREAQIALVLAELDARALPDDDAAGWESELTVADIRLILSERADRRLHYGDEGDSLEECFPDLGWRVPLALIIQAEPNAGRRILLLRRFFEAFREAYTR